MESDNENVVEIPDGITPTSRNNTKPALETNACNTKDIIENARGKELLVLSSLRQNIPGSDFLLCIFFGALQSYRADECVRPFPNKYVENDQKNFTKLRKICESIASLKDILKGTFKPPSEIMSFLTWFFVETGLPTLRKIQLEDIPLPGKITTTLIPDYVFEVDYAEKVKSSWNKRKAQKETFLAYHGSRIENFYSILKFGLQQHFSSKKVVLFGDGIYLTSEITVSANYAPFGQTWKKSMFGSKHSVIAVCEVINDFNKVKCKDVKYKKREVVQGAFGKIPEKYYVVIDSDMVRVKYLLVYKENVDPAVRSYFLNNMSLILIILYILMLLMVGFSNTPTWKQWWYSWQNS